MFRLPILISLMALFVAFLYKDDISASLVTLMLGALEIALSFDNAVVNASILGHMDAKWQRIFLTWGIAISVFGMRLLCPLFIIWVAAGLGPVDALHLALNPPTAGAAYFPDGSPSYETLLHGAKPTIHGFGFAFLAMFTLSFFIGARDRMWLAWIERPLGWLGRLDELPVMRKLHYLRVIPTLATLGMVAVMARFFVEPADSHPAVFAGVTGIVVFLAVKGLGEMFGPEGHSESASLLVGRAAFFSFLYLMVLDSSFSLDGIIGAFAITADPILIVLGLGFIGSMFVLPCTVYLVRRGTLKSFVYLEHGAFWAIGALAAVMMVTSGTIEIPDAATGAIGVVFIGASIVSSIVHNRRHSETAPVVV